MPVIEKNMPATIVNCPKCSQHVMSTIDKFSTEDEIIDILSALKPRACRL